MYVCAARDALHPCEACRKREGGTHSPPVLREQGQVLQVVLLDAVLHVVHLAMDTAVQGGVDRGAGVAVYQCTMVGTVVLPKPNDVDHNRTHIVAWTQQCRGVQRGRGCSVAVHDGGYTGAIQW